MNHILYKVTVGLNGEPFLINLVSIENLIDIKQLEIPKGLKKEPFHIEIIGFNEEGQCVSYIESDSYSFALIRDIEEMINQTLN